MTRTTTTITLVSHRRLYPDNTSRHSPSEHDKHAQQELGTKCAIVRYGLDPAQRQQIIAAVCETSNARLNNDRETTQVTPHSKTTKNANITPELLPR